MAKYPWDYEDTIRIDAEDILDYVKDNKEWFLSQLGKDTNELATLEEKVLNTINRFDYIRRYRDYSESTRKEHSSEIEIYEDLLEIEKIIYTLKGV